MTRAPFTVVPSIDLRAGHVVRLKQGDYNQQINYAVDPHEIAAAFKAAGAMWMHVVDLDGAKEGRPQQTELIADIIRRSGLCVQIGGGVRSDADVKTLIDAGASRVVIGTRAVEDFGWFETLVHTPDFSGTITLALDAKDGMVATHGWTATSSLRAVDVARRVSDWPLAGILYTDVARDGMLDGSNVLETRAMAEAGKVPVIASGGVGSIDDLAALLDLPIWGVIVGRSLYEGKVVLTEAFAAVERAGRAAGK